MDVIYDIFNRMVIRIALVKLERNCWVLFWICSLFDSWSEFLDAKMISVGKIGFIGGGKIAQAMAKGFMAAGEFKGGLLLPE